MDKKTEMASWRTALSNMSLADALKKVLLSGDDRKIAKQLGFGVGYVYRIMRRDAFDSLSRGHKEVWGTDSRIVWVGQVHPAEDSGLSQAVAEAFQTATGETLDSLCRHHALAVTVSVHPKDYLVSLDECSPPDDLSRTAENQPDTQGHTDTPAHQAEPQ